MLHSYRMHESRIALLFFVYGPTSFMKYKIYMVQSKPAMSHAGAARMNLFSNKARPISCRFWIGSSLLVFPLLMSKNKTNTFQHFNKSRIMHTQSRKFTFWQAEFAYFRLFKVRGMRECTAYVSWVGPGRWQVVRPIGESLSSDCLDLSVDELDSCAGHIDRARIAHHFNSLNILQKRSRYFSATLWGYY